MNFVLFSPRHGADVAASELYDFMSASGLQPHELEQRMLDSESAELGAVSYTHLTLPTILLV